MQMEQAAQPTAQPREAIQQRGNATGQLAKRFYLGQVLHDTHYHRLYGRHLDQGKALL